jgi:hypothetical protein
METMFKALSLGGAAWIFTRKSVLNVAMGHAAPAIPAQPSAKP